MSVSHGMNLRDALDVARRLGATVEHVNRTGEGRVSHPSVDKRITFNARKKTASRALTAWLMRLQAHIKENDGSDASETG